MRYEDLSSLRVKEANPTVNILIAMRLPAVEPTTYMTNINIFDLLFNLLLVLSGRVSG